MSVTGQGRGEESGGRGGRIGRWALVVGVLVILTAATFAGSLPSSAPPVPTSPHAGASAGLSAPGHLPTPVPTRLPGFSVPVPSALGARASFPSTLHLPSAPAGGYRIGSWAGLTRPPGLIYPSSGPSTSAGWGNGSWNSTPPAKFCDGIWPGGTALSPGGQGVYAGGASCYGHDEPGLDFYSPIAGSGGNVSWNVTLPTDRSPTENQSNLYSAIWFGMTLTDPYAWMNSCELELQFYPDSGWYAPGPLDPNATVPGLWVGQAVAWQIEGATATEDPCFESPLFANGAFGPNMFNMTQGDRIQVNMTGWPGDLNGENITVHDLTNGNSSFVDLYNHTGNYAHYNMPNNDYILGTPNYPLDPSYGTNNVENALSWTPGGEFPISFAFEVGHGGNPTVPATNPYGGCSPGVPPNHPSTPCPSYDPGSWTNNTATPWQIAPPVFFNATSRAAAVQVGIHQDIGGPGFIDNVTGSAVTTACIGQFPSSWCDYPWYSFSCSQQAFNFGATDFATTTDDFGQANQYALNGAIDSAGLTYYPPQNFSLPHCGAPNYSVTVGGSGGGTVFFLNRSVSAATTFSGLLAGAYSLHATAAAGSVFTGWSTTGSVVVGRPSDPYTSVTVAGGGTATATFAATGGTTVVTFRTNPSNTSIQVVPGYRIAHVIGSNQASGTSLTMKSGVYTVLALPPPAYNFTGWSVSGTGAGVASPSLPYTMFVVTAGGAATTITATFQRTTVNDTLLVEVNAGLGTVTLQGQLATTFAFYTKPLGGFQITANPAAGYALAGWGYSQFVEMTDLYDPTDHFVIQQVPVGFGVAVAAFFAPAVKFVDAPAAGGGVAVASLGLLPVPSGTTLYLSPSTYTIAAAPNGGHSFSGWSVSSSTALWVQQPASAVALLVVNASGTVTANYGPPGVTDAIWLNDTPGTGGLIFFNYALYSNGQENASVSAGVFTAFAFALPGYAFSSWSISGDVASTGISPNVFSITPLLGSGEIRANFLPVAVPVSYIGPVGATISTFSVASGTSAYVDPGTYVLSATQPTNATFLSWSTQGGVAVASTTSASTTVTVTGPGVLWAHETLAGFSISPIALHPGANVSEFATFHAGVSVASGSGPFHYAWNAPAGWCASLTGPTITCNPTSTGRFTIDVTVTDAIGDALTAPKVFVNVLVPLAISGVYASYHALTIGTALTLSASTIGGAAPFSISFSGLPGCVAAGTTGAEVCTPTSVGTFVVTVNATDLEGQFANATTTILVNTALTAPSFTASPADLTLGTPVLLSLTVQGGTTPYTLSYSGLPSGIGCSSANATSVACLPSTAGTFTVTAHVSDHGGGSTSVAATFVVNVLPAIQSFTASPATVTVGQTVTLTVTATGGTAPYTYSYTGQPSDCASRNASTLTCTGRIVGVYTVTVMVTDADGKFTTQAASFTVLPAGGTGPSGSGFTLLDGILIGVVAVVVVVLAVVLLRRRGSQAPPAPPMTAPSAPSPPPPPPSGASGAYAPPPSPPPDPEESFIYGESPKNP